MKPDTLSRQHVSSESPSKPDTILPTTCVVAAVSWGIESIVKEAQQTQPDPGNGPPNRLFVPDSARSQVLQWVHTSRFAHHPGINRSLSLLKRHFWWPTMEADTKPLSQLVTSVFVESPPTAHLLVC